MLEGEHLRLPRGMFDRNSKWVSHELQIMIAHKECGELIGCNVVKYAPVSFKSTFTRECNTANDKIYEFNDRAGRRLVLTCDSTAPVFREYLSRDPHDGDRISFVCPVFRYWTDNAHNRYFTQIGYSIVNEHESSNPVDFHLVQISMAMKLLLNRLSIETKVYLNDYQALRQVFSPYIDGSDLKRFLYRFQFSNLSTRLSMIHNVIEDTRLREQMCTMFSSPPQIITMGRKENLLALPDAYLHLYEMAEALKQTLHCDIYFCPTDLHCIETIDSYTVRFLTDDGYAIAEGGKYSAFAHRFDKRLTTFWSICTGVEPLERMGQWTHDSNLCKTVAVYEFGADNAFILQALCAIRKMDLIPCFVGKITNVRKAVKQAHKKYPFCTILGEDEQKRKRIQLKDFRQNAVFDIIVEYERGDIDGC